MLARLFGGRGTFREPAGLIYREIVARSRRPGLYEAFGVPDTLEGRLEMIMLHSVVLFHRLRREADAGQELSQEVFDAFLADMDRSLREMGVGDLSVPKRMKTIGRSFYGRADAYGSALADRNEARLTEALQRNLFPDETATTGTRPLARYTIAAADALHDQPLSEILVGKLALPEPTANAVGTQ